MKRGVLLLMLLLQVLISAGQLFSLVNKQELKRWEIQDYTIIYSAKQGPAGPVYYEYDVYLGRKYLSYAARIYKGDSCKLLFRDNNAKYILFNLCRQTMQLLKDDKQKLDVADIDSITIRPNDSLIAVLRGTRNNPRIDTFIIHGFDSVVTRRLSDEDVKRFAIYWNKAKTYGFDRMGRHHNYVLTVYQGRKVRRFFAAFSYITESGGWSYNIGLIHFFDRIWFGDQAHSVFDH